MWALVSGGIPVRELALGVSSDLLCSSYLDGTFTSPIAGATIPPSIFSLSALTFLDALVVPPVFSSTLLSSILSHNGINGTMPDFSPLTALSYLCGSLHRTVLDPLHRQLGGNNFSAPAPSSLWTMTQLAFMSAGGSETS